MLKHAIEPFSLSVSAFAAEDDLKILVEKTLTMGLYCFSSVHFKRTRVPFLSQSCSFGGKARPDRGGYQTASNVGQAFPLWLNR